ncbi:MAG: AAA family ATPase [Saprospiraceae bacterium]
MAKDLSKYIFDADNPQDFKAYGLLKKIFKDQNILLVIDLFFFNEIFKDIIWTDDVIEEIWDKPDGFEELSSNEKMEVYVDRFSLKEYYKVINKRSKQIYKSTIIQNIQYIPSGQQILGIQQTSYKNNYEPFFGFKVIVEKLNKDITFWIDEFANSFNKTFTEVFLSNIDMAIGLLSSTTSQNRKVIMDVKGYNVIFMTNEDSNINLFHYLETNMSSVLFCLEDQIDFINNEFKLPPNTHPILLKKPEHIHQLLNKVIQEAKETRLRPKNDVPKAYLKNVKIKNYYTIKDITLNKIYNKKEIYILGENGDGKTLLLQAILMAAKWQQIQNADLEITGIIHQQAKENADLELFAEDTNKQKYKFKEAHSCLENIFAYGVNRQENNADTDEYGYMTLFKKDAFLREPTSWLQRLYTKDLERQANEENVDDFLNLKKAEDLLNDLLEKKVTIKVTADEVRFTERGSENVKFEQLSDGYRSILIWVCDLVSRLANNQPKVTDTRDFHGVVLVDEVGLHLHPKWEATLVQKLRTWFPKIQFIFTTHSPIIILNADEKAVVYRLYKEDGITKISDQYQCSELSDLMLNGLITSPLFDVESAAMRFAENSDLSDDFRLGRLRKLVDEEYQRLKKSGKVYISPTSIDDMIKKIMAEN